MQIEDEEYLFSQKKEESIRSFHRSVLNRYAALKVRGVTPGGRMLRVGEDGTDRAHLRRNV